MLIKLLKEPTSNILIQIFRYLFSGGVAFTVDFSLLYVLTDVLHVHYLLSSIISTIVGLVITYLFSILWIFDQRRFKNWTSEFLIFSLIGFFGLCLTTLFIYFFTEILGQHYLISKIITTIIVSFSNFLLKKIILFSKSPKEHC